MLKRCRRTSITSIKVVRKLLFFYEGGERIKESRPGEGKMLDTCSTNTIGMGFHQTVLALPDPPGVRPVSGHEGRGEQWRHRLVKQEVILMGRSVK